jgi:hypothetical protein
VADSIVGVRLGYEQEEEENTAYMRAPDVSQRGEKRGKADCGLVSWAGPMRGARKWRREAGLAGLPGGCRTGQQLEERAKCREGQQQAFGPKAEKKEDFYFLFLF